MVASKSDSEWLIFLPIYRRHCWPWPKTQPTSTAVRNKLSTTLCSSTREIELETKRLIDPHNKRDGLEVGFSGLTAPEYCAQWWLCNRSQSWNGLGKTNTCLVILEIVLFREQCANICVVIWNYIKCFYELAHDRINQTLVNFKLEFHKVKVRNGQLKLKVLIQWSPVDKVSTYSLCNGHNKALYSGVLFLHLPSAIIF